MLTLRPYQQDISNRIDAAWDGGAQNVCAVLPTGAGKCLGKDTTVLMYDGSVKKVQKIVAGDLLIGPDSEPRRVMSTCCGEEMMYRVTPVKGDPYIVNESHILSLKQTGLKSEPVYPCQFGKGEVTNISVREYCLKSKNFKHTHKGWRSGVEWDSEISDPYLPPYLLGLWLGDGASRGPSITTMDPEIVGYISEFSSRLRLRLMVQDNREGNKSKNYHIRGWGRHTCTFLHSLRANNLIENKHVPLEYKTSSRSDRLELLAGIVDTDGSLSRSGYDIVFKNERLAHDTAFVARSLGLAAYVKKCRKTCCNNGVTGTYHRISISGDCSAIPVRIPHKKAKKRAQVKSVLVTGIKVEKIGVGRYYGFEIDRDRLFLLGDFTVTHNTVVFGNKLAAEPGVTFAIAHRQELVGQMSMALATYGVVHSIQASKKLIAWITTQHTREFGRHYYDPQARCIIGGVQTLINRQSLLSKELGQARLWVIDEGHHVLRDNMWGRCVAMFPSTCRGLLVTATPGRADGMGLGRHAAGVADCMIEGPGMRQLIREDYLTDYRIFGPYSNIDMSSVPVSSKTGDWSKPKMVDAVRGSQIVGDVVQSYLKITPGKIGVTFVPDVKTGEETVQAFNAAGVPARIVHSNTPDRERQESVSMLRRGDLKELVNVDIFGEGFDLPAIEVGSFARPTASYPLYAQQFGRELRKMAGKKFAYIIDHVRNVERHGLPDAHRTWSLDSKEGSSKGKRDPDMIPIRTCRSCTAVFESWEKNCPFCGWTHEAAACGSIEQVEGDITELTSEVLAAMRGEVERVDSPDHMVGDLLRRAGAPEIAVMGAMKQHRLRQEAQSQLREVMTAWAGYQTAAGQNMTTIMRRFFATYGVDVVTAQSLGRRGAEELTAKLIKSIE